MPIICGTVYLKKGDKAFVCCTQENLGEFSWMIRRQAGEFVRFGSRQVAQHCQAGQAESILPDEENSALQYVCHGMCNGAGVFVATMVTDPDYPPKIVYRLLHQLLDRFQEMHGAAVCTASADQNVDFPPLAEFLSNYQDPRQADKAFAIMKDLDETKEVMYKTIDQVLQRGESIESIMEKSEDLSSSSMKFYQTSKKTRCCTIL